MGAVDDGDFDKVCYWDSDDNTANVVCDVDNVSGQCAGPCSSDVDGQSDNGNYLLCPSSEPCGTEYIYLSDVTYVLDVEFSSPS